MEQLSLCVEAVRRFSRFYTRHIGVLHEGYNGSEFSLTEARVIYELAHREAATASDLVKYLGLDAGYLSRLLKSFQERGLVQRQISDVDAKFQRTRRDNHAVATAGKCGFRLFPLIGGEGTV